MSESFTGYGRVWSIEPAYFTEYIAKIRLLAQQKIEIKPRERKPIPIGALTVAQAERAGLPVQSVGNTAIVSVRGVIEKDRDVFMDIFGGTSSRELAAAFDAAASDSNIRSILMAVDSPGGSVDGLAEAADAAFNARQKKPLVAQTDGMAASAAYMIASQAETINSGRMDMIGSIGTRLVLWDMSRMFQNAGVEPVIIDTGEFKSVGEPGAPITERQRADLQRLVDDYFSDFLASIKRGRGTKLSMERLNQSADGRVFLASDAKQRGLIDNIQTLSATLQSMTRQSPRNSTRKARNHVEIALRQHN